VDALEILGATGLVVEAEQSVPEPGKRVWIRRHANHAPGGLDQLRARSAPANEVCQMTGALHIV
jgi:hypothetical protein